MNADGKPIGDGGEAPPRYGTRDDALARLLAERRRHARPLALWPGMLNAALIAALLALGYVVEPVRRAVATLSERGERARPAAAAATTSAQARQTPRCAAYRRVRASIAPLIARDQAAIAPLLAPARARSVGARARLRAVQAWAALHAAWRQACEEAGIDAAAYARCARERPNGPDPIDRLLSGGAAPTALSDTEHDRH